jgi:hypothetical protein
MVVKWMDGVGAAATRADVNRRVVSEDWRVGRRGKGAMGLTMSFEFHGRDRCSILRLLPPCWCFEYGETGPSVGYVLMEINSDPAVSIGRWLPEEGK